MPNHESGDNILGGDRQNALIYLIWMKGRVVIYAIGVGFNIGPHFGTQIPLIARVEGFPNTQPVH